MIEIDRNMTQIEKVAQRDSNGKLTGFVYGLRTYTDLADNKTYKMFYMTDGEFSKEMIFCQTYVRLPRKIKNLFK